VDGRAQVVFEIRLVRPAGDFPGLPLVRKLAVERGLFLARMKWIARTTYAFLAPLSLTSCSCVIPHWPDRARQQPTLQNNWHSGTEGAVCDRPGSGRHDSDAVYNGAEEDQGHQLA